MENARLDIKKSCCIFRKAFKLTIVLGAIMYYPIYVIGVKQFNRYCKKKNSTRNPLTSSDVRSTSSYEEDEEDDSIFILQNVPADTK